jgi:phosphopantothenoylcysteine decarboxylase / phosphopantothenate---cysteine ligase
MMYMKNPRAFVAGHSSGAVLISPNGSSVCVRKKLGHLWALMELLREPASREEIEQALQVDFSEIEGLLGVLEQREIVLFDEIEKLRASIPPRPVAASFPCKKVVVGICGAVQAGLIIPLLVVLQRLIAQQVEIVLTDAAENFVRPELLSYFGFRVWTDMYAGADRIDPETGTRINVPHIYLARSADLVLVIPATASTVQRLATGACSDLISLTVSATEAPVIVVPTMNRAMLKYAPVRKNIAELRNCGIFVVEPGLGFEVSLESDDQLHFCGIGLTDGTIVRAVMAILTAHRELAETLEPSPGVDEIETVKASNFNKQRPAASKDSISIS